MISAVGQIRDAVAAMKLGALEYVTKPFDLDEVMALVQSAVRMGRALQENRQWRENDAATTSETGFVGRSAAAVRNWLEKTRSSVGSCRRRMVASRRMPSRNGKRGN
jgi:DNA-binding NtrC family response regulator